MVKRSARRKQRRGKRRPTNKGKYSKKRFYKRSKRFYKRSKRSKRLMRGG